MVHGAAPWCTACAVELGCRVSRLRSSSASGAPATPEARGKQLRCLGVGRDGKDTVRILKGYCKDTVRMVRICLSALPHFRKAMATPAPDDEDEQRDDLIRHFSQRVL